MHISTFFFKADYGKLESVITDLESAVSTQLPYSVFNSEGDYLQNLWKVTQQKERLKLLINKKLEIDTSMDQRFKLSQSQKFQELIDRVITAVKDESKKQVEFLVHKTEAHKQEKLRVEEIYDTAQNDKRRLESKKRKLEEKLQTLTKQLSIAENTVKELEDARNANIKEGELLEKELKPQCKKAMKSYDNSLKNTKEIKEFLERLPHCIKQSHDNLYAKQESVNSTIKDSKQILNDEIQNFIKLRGQDLNLVYRDYTKNNSLSASSIASDRRLIERIYADTIQLATFYNSEELQTLLKQATTLKQKILSA